jgi:hypothetical protein
MCHELFFGSVICGCVPVAFCSVQHTPWFLSSSGLVVGRFGLAVGGWSGLIRLTVKEKNKAECSLFSEDIVADASRMLHNEPLRTKNTLLCSVTCYMWFC